MGGRGETLMDEIRHGRPLAVDPDAQSASPTEPAFVARRVGAPAYHGFVVLDDVTSGGFTLGKITDFEAEPCDEGVLYLFVSARLAVLCAARFFPCASSLDWMACALTIARISPGKRCSSSVQREVLWTSTPRRSPRISPASLSSLKC